MDDEKTDCVFDACLLTCVWQMDREAVLVFSPDLLGETDELLYSFRQFKYLMDIASNPQLVNWISAPLNSLHPQSKHLPHGPNVNSIRTLKRAVSVSGEYVISPMQAVVFSLLQFCFTQLNQMHEAFSTSSDVCKSCIHVHTQPGCFCGCLAQVALV